MSHERQVERVPWHRQRPLVYIVTSDFEANLPLVVESSRYHAVDLKTKQIIQVKNKFILLENNIDFVSFHLFVCSHRHRTYKD